MAAEARFLELFEVHRAHLQRVAVRLSGDAALAQDLVQDTYVRALQRFDRFEAGTNARAWLVTILTHLYYDHCKHEKVVHKGEPALANAEAVDYDPTITTISDARLYAAIRQLAPELREVVELCSLQQRSYREAAEQLGVPPGTIGTRLMRARAALKLLLDADP
jgi:RNA polymerase sigma-70 factor (ECF subfamily)